MVPQEAFISPDEPFVADKFRDALIFPDDPFPPRERETGTVVGMDGSTEHEVMGSGRVFFDPRRAADVLEAVSTELRERGIDGFRPEGGISTFERKLRIQVTEYFSTHG